MSLQDLEEVDTDPSNNPGRPADPYEYLGMHPPATAALAHPAASGDAGGAGGAGSVGDGGDAGGESTATDSFVEEDVEN